MLRCHLSVDPRSQSVRVTLVRLIEISVMTPGHEFTHGVASLLLEEMALMLRRGDSRSIAPKLTGTKSLAELLYRPARAVTTSREAAHCVMSWRLIAAAISSGKRSGVQAKEGMPNPANAAATL